MDIAARIGRLGELVDRVGEARPDTATLCEGFHRTLASSGRRACMDGPRLSYSARASVASAAMSFVSGVLALGETTKALSFLLSGIASEAVATSPAQELEHVKSEDSAPPAGWSGDGPYVRDSGAGVKLTLAHRPRLPGGDWTVYYGPVPAAFGDSPQSAADMAARMCAALAAGRIGKPVRRPPPPIAAGRGL